MLPRALRITRLSPSVPYYDMENLVYISRPLTEIIKEATSLPRDGSVEYWIDEASKCVEKGKARKSEWNMGKSGNNKDSKDSNTNGKIVEDAFMNFTKAAVILRVKLPSLPEYDKLSEEKRRTIAFVSDPQFSLSPITFFSALVQNLFETPDILFTIS